MVFRRDSKVDAFQRQISALRNQLGGELDAPLPLTRELPALAEDDYPSRLEVPRFEREPSDRLPDSFGYAPMVPQPAIGTSLPAIPAVDDRTSVLSHTTTWTGDLNSTGSLHVHGRVEGSLTARDQIYVAEEAEVDASLQANSVTIAGSARGAIRCAERFEVLPRGKFAGDVWAPVIVIHDGALVSGEITMTAAGESARAARPAPRVARGGD
ncbi:MAG: polymer-forming cytoskeletal protein [Thermomicrobiales bacterium]